MHWQKMPEYLTEYFKYMYQRFMLFIAVIICKSECVAEFEHFNLIENSHYELNFGQGKKNGIYRRRQKRILLYISITLGKAGRLFRV